jgi:excinuclease ABC subunit A
MTKSKLAEIRAEDRVYQSRAATELDTILVKGAREHNLQNVDVELPKKKLIVFTGVSGSGKSSLAYDTIFAEGQRRYVESLSAYARQFIGQLDKPRYDMIRGLSPAIAIDQKAASRNPRSTVGTITEIYDYLRVLFARIGEQFCIHCGRKVGRGDAQVMVGQIMDLPPGTRILVMAPGGKPQGRTPRPTGQVAPSGIRPGAHQWSGAGSRKRSTPGQAKEARHRRRGGSSGG